MISSLTFAATMGSQAHHNASHNPFDEKVKGLTISQISFPSYKLAKTINGEVRTEIEMTLERSMCFVFVCIPTAVSWT